MYLPKRPLSQPYWLKNEMKEGHFEINDQQLIGNAEKITRLCCCISDEY